MQLNSILKNLVFRLRGILKGAGPSPTSIIETLPNEILAHIATFLKPADLANLQLLSQDFHALSHDAFDIAWQPYLEKLKEIDPTVSFISWQKKTRQVQLKEHFMRIAREQFEEIQFLQNSSKDEVSSARPSSQLRNITEPAKTLGEMQQREQLLNQFNAQLIKRKCQSSFLQISKMDLTRFPKELFKDDELTSYWAQLTHLDLSYNLIKCLPDELATSFTALTLLDCSGNKLTALPENLSNSAISQFFCNNNKLTALPNFNAALTYFYCDHNKLTALPDLGNCTELKNLKCSNNELKIIPDTLGNCTELMMFDCDNNKLTAIPNLSKCTKLWHIACSNNKLTALPQWLANLRLEILNLNGNSLKKIPDEIRVRYTEKWYTQTMASQKNLFLANIRKQIKASQNYLKGIGKNWIAQLIEPFKAPSDHPLKVGLLSALSFAVGSMSLFSSSALLAPSILLGGLVTMGIKTKNHFTNKALHKAEQQPNSDSAAAPVSAGEKRDSNWYQYAQGLYTSVLFAAGNQRVENNVGAQPENTSTVNTMLKP